MELEHAFIGRRIRELRKWRRMDLAAVAGLAGMSPSYLSLIERGKRPVTKRMVLERVAAALRVSPTDLVPADTLVADQTSPDTHAAMAVLGDLLSGWWVGEVPDSPGRPLPEVLDELRASMTHGTARVRRLPATTRPGSQCSHRSSATCSVRL